MDTSFWGYAAGRTQYLVVLRLKESGALHGSPPPGNSAPVLLRVPAPSAAAAAAGPFIIRLLVAPIRPCWTVA